MGVVKSSCVLVYSVSQLYQLSAYIIMEARIVYCILDKYTIAYLKVLPSNQRNITFGAALRGFNHQLTFCDLKSAIN